MIVGIADGDIPVTAPSTPVQLGILDFANSVYTYNSTTYALSDVIDQPGWVGASGLAIPGSAGAGAQIILSPLTTRLATCQWTMVLGIELLVTSPRSLLFTETNAGDAYYIQVDFDTEWDCFSNDGVTGQFPADITHAIATGIHKFAMTRTDTRSTVVVDGNPIDGAGPGTSTATCTLPVIGFPMVNFYLGGYSSSTEQAVNIRSLALYDPVADADLPALSAP